MNMRQWLERLGRRWLMALGTFGLRAKRAPLALPAAPRILVVRLDERLGNLLLLTPVLRALRARFPAAQLDVLANGRGGTVLATHPAVSCVLGFRKRALWAADGPLWAPWRLRRRRYDLAIDMANPHDPSLTQALLTRLSGAAHTVGSAHERVAAFYTQPVGVPAGACHEVDLRLALLGPVLGADHRPPSRHLSVPVLPLPPASPVRGFLAASPGPFAVLNLGARLRSKQLAAEDYAATARAVAATGLVPVLTWGPAEEDLAQATHAQAPGSQLAPPTGVAELAALMRAASVVVSCDTGPMHLSVATGTPTCGIFVSTDPARFGHTQKPHTALDARGRALQDVLPALKAWLSNREGEWHERYAEENADTARLQPAGR